MAAPTQKPENMVQLRCIYIATPGIYIKGWVKIMKKAARLKMLLALVLLLTALIGCAEDERPIPTDEAVLAAAREQNVPVIQLQGRGADWFERTVQGRYLPEFGIRITNGTLLAWNINGQNLRLLQYDGVLRPRQREYRTNPLELVEGENELIIWAIGPTRLIVERRFIITSDQTTPEEQRTAMPRLNDVTINYDPEFPTIVTVAFEFIGDYYGDVLRASAVAYGPARDDLWEDVDVTDKGGGVFEVTVQLVESAQRPGDFSRSVRITLENEWNVPTQGDASVSTGTIDGSPQISWIGCSNRGVWGLGGPPR